MIYVTNQSTKVTARNNTCIQGRKENIKLLKINKGKGKNHYVLTRG